jgi:predicted dehydrogenase
VGDDDVVVVADTNRDAAEALARRAGCRWSADWRVAVEALADAIVICTPPHTHNEVARHALRAGRHVLCEKPLAVTAAAAWEMVAEAERAERVLKCGFNYRYHPAIVHVGKLVRDGRLGRLALLRSRHGTGGRPQFEREWRTHADQGGGILMDQGVHVLDLFRWLAGPFPRVVACTVTSYWPIAPVEDNVFAVLEGEGLVATLHVSWTQWKNLFTLDVIGSEGSVSVEGLGGSYGDERVIYRRASDPERAQDVTEFRGSDRSWQDEWREFTAAVARGQEPSESGRDGAEVLTLVEAVYRSSREARAVDVGSASGVGAQR